MIVELIVDAIDDGGARHFPLVVRVFQDEGIVPVAVYPHLRGTGCPARIIRGVAVFQDGRLIQYQPIAIVAVAG